MIWYAWIQTSAMLKQQDGRCCGFSRSIPLSIDYVWNSSIDWAISTSSCSIAYEIDTAKIAAALLWIFYCLNDLIRLNSIVSHVQTTKCMMIGFRCSIPLSIECVWNSSMDRAISSLSCSYCIWNRWCHNYSRIMPNFLLFIWFDTVEFNRLPCARARCTMMLFSMIYSDIS